MLEQSKNAKLSRHPTDLYVVDLLDDLRRTAGDDLDALLTPLLEDPRLLRLVQYMLQHLSEPLLARDAAKIVAFETKYFSKYFGKQTGYNFVWWNREIRLRVAKTLLRQRGRTIHNVAQAVGYRNLTTFERAFKKSTGGMGPRVYHRMHAPSLNAKDV